MAARAYAVTDPAEMAKVLELFGGKFPEYRTLPQPDLSAMRLFMVVPAGRVPPHPPSGGERGGIIVAGAVRPHWRGGQKARKSPVV